MVTAPASLSLLYVSQAHTTHDRRFLGAFAEAGYRTTHWTLTAASCDARPLPPGVRQLAWRHPRAGAWGQGLAAFLALRAALREVRPDVVLAGPVPSAALLVALAGFRPLVSMSWGSDLLVTAVHERRAALAARFALRRSAAAFGDCRAVHERFRALSALPEDRILTFPWGIDLARFDPRPSALDLRQRLGWGTQPVLLCTRTWEPVYAVDAVVRAFARVLERHPGARLILTGDGSQAPLIRQLIDTLGVAHAVHAPGRIGYDAIAEYYRVADVYVSAALSDGTSISLLEAMACGLPVVVTAAHGNLEWVEEGVNGWLVKPGDADALAGALDAALSCPDRGLSMGRANRAVAEARADWSRNIPRLTGLLSAVARQPNL